MMRLVLATRNRGKIREMTAALQGLDVEICSSLDFPHLPPILEDGLTFRENAVKKAESVCHRTGLLSLADDSGLEIDALRGRPGIQSSRFAGAKQDDDHNIDKVLNLLRDVPPDRRQARFRCVIALAGPGEETATAEGTCEGSIALERRGSSGFGYDPIFLPAGHGKTFAELGPAVKDRISHRAKALQAARDILREKLRA